MAVELAASALELFSPPAREWFQSAFGEPTPVQEQGWRSVAAGRHTLMCAPTGSGKTLAAFFWCLDRLSQEPQPAALERCRVLYISPLKALTVDIERNLRPPLRGIFLAAGRSGEWVPELAVGVRTGDTAARDRRGMERNPPDVLVTTPESLFLLLTSAARSRLRSVRWVIVDEIHALAASKRGAHLALSLERLGRLTGAEPQRIGLSATQRPLDEVGRFLAGTGRECSVVDAGPRRTLEISVEVPVEDMAALTKPPAPRSGPAAAIGPDPPSPQRSIWPAIHPRILELVRQHRSTIIFVNSRRLAERLAAQLNELAGQQLVRAHHGSIAREQRTQIEDDLKAGRIPALVATSSLELGIDMGAVDLVIQIESPTTAARGIQRIGRAGHSVGAPSRGVILPKHRGDLLECAAVVERMLAGEVERTVVPRNPIDVLAQQIVAMSAMDEWLVDELRATVRRAYPFSELGDRAFEGVLDMLDGRYVSEDFAELRPRIVYERSVGSVRGRQGAQRLAVTSGGTIPDRGLYTVNILDDGRRVGELDEEMVYELRPGETFVLGASTWRVAEITPAQVLVVPAPGEPGKIAFWHGDALGRPVELGLAMGALVRSLQTGDEGEARARLRQRSCFDERAAANLLAYLRDQRESAGAVPDDRTVVVERFRDQLGDWRVCVLTPWGARVHTPWALVVEHRLCERLGVDVQTIATDDGFAIRLPETDQVPDVDELLLDPDEVADLVVARLHDSALFAARFRENAARALLLPRRRPGQRTPLWQQRQRSHDLLEVASRHPDFPILIETYRECLTTVFDIPALGDLMRRLRSREVRMVEVETQSSSPFAASLLFDYIAQYMYEGDAPLAERRAQALTLDRELLAELLGNDELRELLDPDAISELELELQALTESRRARNPDEAVDLLRRLGDLDSEELAARGVEPGWLAPLEAARRVVAVRLAGSMRWIAAEDAGRYRDALGTALPPGLPDAVLNAVPEPLESLLRRWARTHVPFVAESPGSRWGVPPALIDAGLRGLVGSGELLSGQFRAAGAREYCAPDVVRALRRRSLARLRREVEPVSPETLLRFVPRWQGVGGDARGLERLLEVVDTLQGVPLPVSVLERDVLPARVAHYSPGLLDALMSGGEVVWIGRGPLGGGDGRVALYLRDSVSRLVAAPVIPSVTGAIQAELRDALRRRGACFFRDLLLQTSSRDEEEVLEALWDLVWAGEVTNDSAAPLRGLSGGRHRRTRPGIRRLGPPRARGRWAPVADLLEPPVTPTERMAAQARVLLNRHGVVTREAVIADAVPGGFAGVYATLRQLEEAGRVRRGYFVDGLGGSQFALPGAVDRLRAVRELDPDVLVLAATDPANQYGVTVAWPPLAGRAARTAGAYVILESGELRLFIERGGRSMLSFGAVGAAAVSALGIVAARLRKLEVMTVDGIPVSSSPLAGALREAGFVPTPRGLILVPASSGWRSA
ncbi:MAG: DEAD/DEAH box helicase [Candidatus Dormibacteria bacterium]